MQGQWLQIDIDQEERGGLSARVSSSSGKRSSPRQPVQDITVAQLEALGEALSRAAGQRRSIPFDLQEQARQVYLRLFVGEIARIFDRLVGEANGGRLLVRLMLSSPALQSFPWEALCGPTPGENEIGCHHQICLSRGVFSSESAPGCEVNGAIRLLVISPQSEHDGVYDLRSTLEECIQAGQVEWLEPVTGSAARWRHLRQRLQQPPWPHIIHFIGHGRVINGSPELKLEGDEEASWISAELFASALARTASNQLRLVYLESCAGGSPGVLASAAERIAARAVEAVIANLWPVASDAARTTARSFYQTLIGTGIDAGNVAASLNGARQVLAGDLKTAEFLSPVLFLRGTEPELFDFRARMVEPVASHDLVPPPSGPLDARSRRPPGKLFWRIAAPVGIVVALVGSQFYKGCGHSDDDASLASPPSSVPPRPSATPPPPATPGPTVTPPPDHQSPPVSRPTPVHPPPKPAAYVTIRVIPSADIYLDDKYLGPSPVRDYKIEPGYHKLRYLNAELGIDRTVERRIDAESVGRRVAPWTFDISSTDAGGE